MPRKKVITEETFDKDEEAAKDSEIALDGANLVLSDELDAIIGEDGDDTKYTVHRLPTKPGEKVAYCNVYTKSDLSLDTIRATFGGGQYRITGRDTKNQYVRQKVVTLLDLPKAPGATAGAANADLAAVLAAAKNGSNDMMPLIMEMIRSQGAQTNALLTAMAQNKPAAPTGPTFMEIMALMKEMNHKPDDSAVKVLLQGLELGQKLNGGGETGMMDVAKQGLEMLAPLIADGQSNPRPRPQPRANGQAPRVQQPTTQAPAAAQPAVQTQEQPNPMLQKLNWLRALTQTLVVHAIKEHDPETYAEVVLDNLPPFITEDEILERLTPDNSVSMLAQLNPDVAKYPVWFEEFRQAMIRFLTEEEETLTSDSPDGQSEVPGDLEP